MLHLLCAVQHVALVLLANLAFMMFQWTIMPCYPACMPLCDGHWIGMSQHVS